jgi:hypothetical protein
MRNPRVSGGIPAVDNGGYEYSVCVCSTVCDNGITIVTQLSRRVVLRPRGFEPPRGVLAPHSLPKRARLPVSSRPRSSVDARRGPVTAGCVCRWLPSRVHLSSERRARVELAISACAKGATYHSSTGAHSASGQECNTALGRFYIHPTRCSFCRVRAIHVRNCSQTSGKGFYAQQDQTRQEAGKASRTGTEAPRPFRPVEGRCKKGAQEEAHLKQKSTHAPILILGVRVCLGRAARLWACDQPTLPGGALARSSLSYETEELCARAICVKTILPVSTYVTVKPRSSHAVQRLTRFPSYCATRPCGLSRFAARAPWAAVS